MFNGEGKEFLSKMPFDDFYQVTNLSQESKEDIINSLEKEGQYISDVEQEALPMTYDNKVVGANWRIYKDEDD